MDTKLPNSEDQATLEKVLALVDAASAMGSYNNNRVRSKVIKWAQGLYLNAEFKVGDKVHLKEPYICTKEESPGWYHYRKTFVPDNYATVMEVHWREPSESKQGEKQPGRFSYLITFNTTYSENEKGVHYALDKKSSFFFPERFLTNDTDVSECKEPSDKKETFLRAHHRIITEKNRQIAELNKQLTEKNESIQHHKDRIKSLSESVDTLKLEIKGLRTSLEAAWSGNTSTAAESTKENTQYYWCISKNQLYKHAEMFVNHRTQKMVGEVYKPLVGELFYIHVTFGVQKHFESCYDSLATAKNAVERLVRSHNETAEKDYNCSSEPKSTKKEQFTWKKTNHNLPVLVYNRTGAEVYIITEDYDENCGETRYEAVNMVNDELQPQYFSMLEAAKAYAEEEAKKIYNYAQDPKVCPVDQQVCESNNNCDDCEHRY